MKRCIALAGLGSILCLVSCTESSPDGRANSTGAPTGSTTTTTPARQPDNTGVNTRDRDATTITPPDQASGTEADRTITAEVRRAITSESGMSVNARNVKIVTLNGVVTLRGPVETMAERDLIEAKARAVGGVTRVDNQLEVKAP